MIKIIWAVLVVPVVLVAGCSSAADPATSSSLPTSTTAATASTLRCRGPHRADLGRVAAVVLRLHHIRGGIGLSGLAGCGWS